MLSPPARWISLSVAVGVFGACSLEQYGALSVADEDAGIDSGVGGTSFDDASFGGGAGGDKADAGANEAEAAVTLPYAFRRRLTVTPGSSGVPAGGSLSLHFDHRALVLAGKARGDGKDLRVFFKGSGPSQEIDRVLDPASGWDRSDTTIWFKAQADIAAQPDGSYYLYYGDASAPDAPADANKAYAFFDDFSGSTLAQGWIGAQVGSASGTFTVAGGVLRIEGATGDIWNNGDDFLFLHRSMSGNFVLDARVSASGGSASGWAKLGGVMIRESLAKGSKNRIVSPVNGSAAITSSYRLATDAITEEAAKSGAKLIPELVRLARRFDGARAWHSDDGVSFAELGAETTFSGVLPDAVLIGIPFANLTAGKGWVEIDWFRARLLLEAEPELSEQPEEPGPFSP